MRVSVVTNDRYLYRFIELELLDVAEVSDTGDEGADVVVLDCDSGFPAPEVSARIIMLSRNHTTDYIPIPLPRGLLKELVSSADKKPLLYLSGDGKCAVLKGKTIKLTAHEFSLLSLLLEGGENFTSREEISKKVWGDASDGLINIYIHYLREKLERDGEKIIVSSRKYGYKINSAYVKNTGDAGERGALS